MDFVFKKPENFKFIKNVEGYTKSSVMETHCINELLMIHIEAEIISAEKLNMEQGTDFTRGALMARYTMYEAVKQRKFSKSYMMEMKSYAIDMMIEATKENVPSTYEFYLGVKTSVEVMESWINNIFK